MRPLLLTLILALGITAQAHTLDLNRAVVALEGNKAFVDIAAPSSLFKAFDDNRDGLMSAGEASVHREAIEAFLSERIQVLNQAGEPGRVFLYDAVVSQTASDTSAGSDHLRLIRQYEWSRPPQQLTVRYGLLEGQATLTVTATVGGKAETAVLSAAQLEHTFGDKPSTSLWQFVVLGVEHILTGYDHLLFLLALILAAGSLVNLLRVITAFTVAHSITIALTVLGIVQVPSYLVEGVIALSIAFVALENLFKPQASPWRWLVVFAFGLVHGMGFAGVLQDIGLPQGQVLPSILSFNIGVELGQIAFVLVVSSLLALIQRVKFNLAPIQRWGSVAVAAMALYWSVERFFA